MSQVIERLARIEAENKALRIKQVDLSVDAGYLKRAIICGINGHTPYLTGPPESNFGTRRYTFACTDCGLEYERDEDRRNSTLTAAEKKAVDDLYGPREETDNAAT